MTRTIHNRRFVAIAGPLFDNPEDKQAIGGMIHTLMTKGRQKDVDYTVTVGTAKNGKRREKCFYLWLAESLKVNREQERRAEKKCTGRKFQVEAFRRKEPATP